MDLADTEVFLYCHFTSLEIATDSSAVTVALKK